MFQDVHGIADPILGGQCITDVLRSVTVCRVIDHGVQTVGQTVDAEPAHWYWQGSTAKCVYSSSPEALIAQYRTDQSRPSGSQPCGSRPCAAVVNYRRGSREQLVMRH